MKTQIDTSFLRKSELETALKEAAAEDRFVVSDALVLETLKNEHWETTARNSFKILSCYPDKILAATEPSKLIIQELESGKDTFDVVNSGLTITFRQLLRELAAGVDGIMLKSIRDTIVAAQEKVEQQQLNHTENLASLKGVAEEVNDNINRKAYLKIASEEEKRIFRLRYAKTMSCFGTGNVALEEGKTQAIGDALANGRGLMLRQQIGFNLRGFRWFELGGIGSFPAEKATNELMDLDHVLMSTYCDRILSKEPWLAVMRQDILDALDLAPFSADELRRGQNTLTEPSAA